MAVDTVSISEQILGRILVSEGLDDLLGRPGCTGMLRHMEMQHLATTMFQHQEHEQQRGYTLCPAGRRTLRRIAREHKRGSMRLIVRDDLRSPTRQQSSHKFDAQFAPNRTCGAR